MNFHIDNQRMVATTRLRKICFGKIIQGTRVNIAFMSICGTFSIMMYLCFNDVEPRVRPALLIGLLWVNITK